MHLVTKRVPMADFTVFNNQVLFGTFAAGTAFVLFVWLVYRAIWRPRKMESEGEEVHITNVRTFFEWLFATIPWAVIVAIIASTIYTIVHIYHSARIPPDI